MANIRASGFDSKEALQEHLLELVPENEPVSGGETDVNRAAEMELAWLQKEVVELQDQFLNIGRKAVEPKRPHTDSSFWFKVALTVVAGCAAGTLIQRL